MISTRRSKIHGTGVFANKIIPKNKRIINYTGEIISIPEFEKRDKKHLRVGQMWCFELTKKLCVDASVGGNISRFVNHSSSPNCWIEIKGYNIWFRASRKIRIGEELTIDYGSDLPPN